MKQNQRYAAFDGSWKRIAFGVGVGILTVFTVTGAAAWMIDSEIVGAEQMGLFGAAALLSGSFLGGISVGRGEGRFLGCGIVGAGIVLILLVLNLVFFDGSLPGLLPGSLAIAGGCAAAGLLGGGRRGGKDGHYRYRKYRNR